MFSDEFKIYCGAEAQGQVLAAIEVEPHKALVCPDDHKKPVRTDRLSLEQAKCLRTSPSLAIWRSSKERALYFSDFSEGGVLARLRLRLSKGGEAVGRSLRKGGVSVDKSKK